MHLSIDVIVPPLRSTSLFSRGVQRAENYSNAFFLQLLYLIQNKLPHHRKLTFMTFIYLHITAQPFVLFHRLSLGNRPSDIYYNCQGGPRWPYKGCGLLGPSISVWEISKTSFALIVPKSFGTKLSFDFFN